MIVYTLRFMYEMKIWWWTSAFLECSWCLLSSYEFYGIKYDWNKDLNEYVCNFDYAIN